MKKSFKEILEEKAKAGQSPIPNAPPTTTTPPKGAFGKLLETKTKASAGDPTPQTPPSMPGGGTSLGSPPPPLVPPAPAAQPRSQLLEDVIAHIPRDGLAYKCQRGELLFAYHPKEQAASQCLPQGILRRIVSNWTSPDLLYYRLRPAQEVTLPPVELPLKDGAGLVHPVDVSVTILGVASGRESDAVARLARDSSPRDTLYKEVVTWLENFAAAERRSGRDPVESFTLSQRTQASAYIAERSLGDLGLRLECGFYFPEKDLQPPPIQLTLSDVRVRESGLPGALRANIEVRLRLPIDPTRFAYARQMRRGLSTICQDIEALALDWFRASCTLDQFCFAHQDVRLGLDRAIRGYAEQRLYMDCDPIVVQCDPPFPKDFRLRLDYTSKARVQPGQHELVVIHNLSIKRHNLGLFYTQGPRPLSLPADADAWNTAFEKWVDDVCARATHDIFHGKSYAKVSLEFTKLSESLKAAVESRFTEIGFTALPIHSLPLDPEIQICLERKTNFDTGDIQCKTCESTVDYALSAHVSLEINSLDKIENYLLPGHALKSQFIEVAKDTIKNTVRVLDPETLYTKFALSGAESQEASPEDKLRAALALAFREKFDANDKTIAITLSPVPTDVTKLYDELRPYGNHPCPVSVEMLGRRGETLSFSVEYRVASIASWPVFQEQCRKNPSVKVEDKAQKIFAAIDGALASKAQTKLRSLTIKQLASPNPNVPKLIEAFGLKEAIEQIGLDLGVDIRITNILSIPGKLTTRERDLENEFYNSALEDFRTADKQYRELEVQYGSDDDRVKEALARVDRCKEKLENFGSGHDEELKGAPTLPPHNWTEILRLDDANEKEGSREGG